MALTDVAIKRAKAKESPYKLGDSGGMFLWVTPSGGKSWRWSYRYDGKQKLMALGLYPDVSLVLARERHARGRKLLGQGIDPMAERKATKTAERIADQSSFAI